MSIYATFFILNDHDDHEESCARYLAAGDDEPADTTFFGEPDRHYNYDPEAECTCEAMRGPYNYEGSHRSISGPNHRRDGTLTLCRAVGTNTIRLSLDNETVLLDARQVKAMRDALNDFCAWADNPADYGREDAFDVAAEPIDKEVI